jgi:hypothetical protein
MTDIREAKKTKSRIFSYYNKTSDELRETLLNKQKESLEEIDATLKEAEEANEELHDFNDELQKKAALNWNDVKKMEQYIERQAQYQKMFEKQTNELRQRVDELPTSEEMLDKKSALQDRMNEIQQLNEEEKLLEELNELTDKLQREDMIDKLKKLSERSRNNKKDLERLVELTKRFYVEQKIFQLAENIDSLSSNQEALSEKELDDVQSDKQEEVNKEFDKIKEELENLEKENEGLKRPMPVPDTEKETDEIEELLDQIEQQMSEEDKMEDGDQKGKERKRNQKKAAQKMKALSEDMKESMMKMEGEMIDENIEDLRKIVENLIEFSFQQENLMENFRSINNDHPDYPSKLQRQHVLKDYFEHIDDSLYTLSLRMVSMGNEIQKEIYNAQYNMDEALTNFTENRFEQGTSNQQFVITAANTLANNLSDLLEQLQNASAQMGKGEGNGKQEFSLPDIIKKQGELNEKMQEEGEQEGRGTEEMNEALFEIYKQQAELRGMLQELLEGENGKPGSKEGDAIRKMEELEEQLLDKGLSQDLVHKAIQLNYELLKLEKARKEQGLDTQRIGHTNEQTFKRPVVKKLTVNPPYFNYDEILQRQSLPLRSVYRKKVLEYFKTEK